VASRQVDGSMKGVYSALEAMYKRTGMESDSNTAAPREPVLKKAIIALATIFVVTFALISFSLLLQGNFGSILSHPVQWFNGLDSSIAFDIVSTTAELLAAVLAIAVTVIAIVVELAANRYSHRITSLFLREPINIFVMSFFVVATIYSIWIALTLEANVEGASLLNAGLLTSMLMVTISLVVLLPYFAFVMSFLSPMSIILKIQNSALESIVRTDAGDFESPKLKLLHAVDELQDMARRSVELSDRAVEMASINAMLNLTLAYQELIKDPGAVAGEWFQVTGAIKNDPDFISINSASLELIGSEKLWVEVKILRQYLDLMSGSNPSSRDTSYLIAINTKKIATESLRYRPKLELVHLCMRCFNSYLRATVNNKDERTGYYIMNQYRLLAEELLAKGEVAGVEDIANYLQFYGILGFKLNLPFLLEVAAEDVAQLAGESIGGNHDLLDKLLGLLLDLDQEVKKEFQESSLLGVRRAQLKLATRLLETGDEERAVQICDDLKDEKPERIEYLIELLQSQDDKEYWEFTDRGVNFGYLDPGLRPHLDTISGWLSVDSA
jgi:hypothetical protein